MEFSIYKFFIQISDKKQVSHSGFLALQMYLPWRRIQWWAFSKYFFGVTLTKSSSTWIGVLPDESPIRGAVRRIWVSTAIAGFPKPIFKTTFAVLRPTPGSFISSSIVSGTLPEYSF